MIRYILPPSRPAHRLVAGLLVLHALRVAEARLRVLLRGRDLAAARLQHWEQSHASTPSGPPTHSQPLPSPQVSPVPGALSIEGGGFVSCLGA